jgi:hypothetical protein
MTTVECPRPRRSGTACRRRTLRDPVAVGCLVVRRDVLSRLLYDGRTSLVGGTVAVLAAFVVGAPLGLVSGFYRGRLAGPERRHDHNSGQALGVIMAPMLFRLIRPSVLAVREELYVDAVRVPGLGDARIMRRHILPYGEKAVVDGVDLTVARGEVVGLVGESGSGKSQTAFSVLGLLPGEAEVTADRLTFVGKELLTLDATGLNALRGYGIGYIPQEPMSNLDPLLPDRLPAGGTPAQAPGAVQRGGPRRGPRPAGTSGHCGPGAGVPVLPAPDLRGMAQRRQRPAQRHPVGTTALPLHGRRGAPLARHAYEGSVAGRCSR